MIRLRFSPARCARSGPKRLGSSRSRSFGRISTRCLPSLRDVASMSDAAPARSRPTRRSKRMWFRRSGVLLIHELRVTLRDAAPLAVVLIIPLAMAFAKSSLGSALRDAGYRHANGAEQVVPGLSVLLCFMMISFVGEAFFREHRWGTWERLRATELRPSEIMLAKVVPLYLYFLFALVMLFGVGFAVFGLEWPRAPVAL